MISAMSIIYSQSSFLFFFFLFFYYHDLPLGVIKFTSQSNNEYNPIFIKYQKCKTCMKQKPYNCRVLSHFEVQINDEIQELIKTGSLNIF